MWYEGSDTSDRRFLLADERGSIVSVADSAGAVLAINTYDEFGIPASTNVGRFQFSRGSRPSGGRGRPETQAWLPEAGLFYYKARMYSPTLGRFLQTDPIGYADGLNWYTYVGGDPINSVDPLGLCGEDDNDDPGCDIVVTALRPISTISVVSFSTGGGGGGGVGPGFTSSRVSEGALEDPDIVVSATRPQDDDIIVTARRHRYVIRFLNPCSASSVFGYFKQAGHSAPGAPAAREGFTRRLVLTGGNPISQYVNSSTGTIINTTLPGHRYYPGTVRIQVTPNEGGQTSTTVITGEGTGAHSEENVILGEAFFGGQAAGAQTACGI